MQLSGLFCHQGHIDSAVKSQKKYKDSQYNVYIFTGIINWKTIVLPNMSLKSLTDSPAIKTPYYTDEARVDGSIPRKMAASDRK